MRRTIFLFAFFCGTVVSYSQSFVDPETPAGILPANSLIGEDWVLDFSDEFNGNEVDTKKWTIDNSSQSRTPRPDIGVSSWFWRPANVEMKDGNLVLKVRKVSATSMHTG